MSKEQKRNPQGQFVKARSGPSAARIYEAHGMTEFVAMIPVGHSRMALHLTGGSINGYGQRPASAEIDDPVFQQYIEASPLYRSGKITGRPKPLEEESKQDGYQH